MSFRYHGKTKTAIFDGYVAGSSGKVRRRKTIANVTRAQALHEYSVFRAELARGRATRGPLTFAAFLQVHWAAIAAPLAPTTAATYRSLIDQHLCRVFGKILLEEITTVRVLDFKTDMRNRGCSASYINDAVRLLKTLLRQAVERDALADYPIKKKISKEREVLLRLELTPEERARFFRTFDDEQAFRDHVGAHRRRNGRLSQSAATAGYFARYRELRDFFVVAVETGLRNRSDLRNLQWREVDLAGGFIRLTMQKTGFEATIPISRACRAVLARLHACRGAAENVFVDAVGRRLSPSRIKRAFKLAKALAGITRRLRVHDLRHTFGCRLASGGVPLQMIAKALGHTTTKMAERYARPSEESMRIIVGALDRDECLPE